MIVFLSAYVYICPASKEVKENPEFELPGDVRTCQSDLSTVSHNEQGMVSIHTEVVNFPRCLIKLL